MVESGLVERLPHACRENLGVVKEGLFVFVEPCEDGGGGFGVGGKVLLGKRAVRVNPREVVERDRFAEVRGIVLHGIDARLHVFRGGFILKLHLCHVASHELAARANQIVQIGDFILKLLSGVLGHGFRRGIAGRPLLVGEG